MGTRDKQFFFKIKTEFERANLGSRLTQENIAGVMGINPKTFSSWLIDGGTNQISLDKWSELYQKLRAHHNPAYRNLANYLYILLAKEHCKAMGINSISELIDQLRDIERYAAECYPHELTRFMASNSVTVIAASNSRITPSLQTLFTAGCAIKQLHLIVCAASLESIKADMEEWAYGVQGNYSEHLNISVFVREQEPLAEMVGVFIQGKFYAFIYQDGYVPMSELGCELLLDQEQRLLDEKPVWQLPKTPVARIITRLMRDYSEDFPKDVLSFLAHKIDGYEANKTLSDRQNNVWDALNQSLVADIRANFGHEPADAMWNRIEHYRLQQ